MRRAAREAFLQAGGVECCQRLVGALAACAPPVAASAGAVAVATQQDLQVEPPPPVSAAAAADGVLPRASLQAEALWLWRATTRLLSMLEHDRSSSAPAATCLEAVGGAGGMGRMLEASGLLRTGQAAAALGALLEVAGV